MPLLGTRGAASARGFGFGAAAPATPAGQQAYTTAGTYTWVCPAGVTSVSVVCVGGGRIGGGGLGYKNNISVTPGSSYTVGVGAASSAQSGAPSGGDSYFINTSTVMGGGAFSTSGGTFTGDGGGNGGDAGNQGGGGAGGYAGKGGNGANSGAGFSAAANSGGGGGGGGYAGKNVGGAGGGGVGLLGIGSTGAGGASSAQAGQGGSGGSAGGGGNPFGGDGGQYGGGVGRPNGAAANAVAGNGAVRIIWAGGSGITRAFPGTNTGNL